MTRSILYRVLGVLSVIVVATLPLACPSGGIGDPCTPEDEYAADFSGFKVSEENVESRSFQCQTRICLVNHFQGRVSCPQGQPPPASCGAGEPCAGDGEKCIKAGTFIDDCEKNEDCGSGRRCNAAGKFCECKDNSDCPLTGSVPYFCDGDPDSNTLHQCVSKVCHKPGNCQVADVNADNTGKQCCVPGTDTPVTSPVCGQCQEGLHRSAGDAVYCSCRCGPPDEQTPEQKAQDENFNFCDCPTGYECQEIRKNVGLGDPQITGKYCIKAETFCKGSDCQGSCGTVTGYFSSELKCQGLGG